VLYADPPSKYNDKLIEGYGAAEHHYRPMSIEELCEPRFAALAANNAVLFIWATSPFLEKCFAVIRAWDFEYKSSFIWDKVKHNYGHYNSVRHEFLLVCTKGSCTPDSPVLIDSVVQVERTDPSLREAGEVPGNYRLSIHAIG
jgi:N6-adenosine-specific RNA methylase IME4